MSQATHTLAQPARHPLTALLPREHGSWALALEPLALALIAAPSWRGAVLSAAVVALFLMRRPWQLATASQDRFRARQAWRALGGLATLAAVGAGLALRSAPVSMAIPLLSGGFLGALFAWFDGRRAARGLAPELAGAGCFAAFAAAVVLCSGRPAAGGLALVVGGFSFSRALTSILPVRVYLRRRKGEAVGGAGAVLIAAGFAVAAAASAGVIETWIPALWACLFLARTIWLVGVQPPAWPARRLGMVEMALGVAAVITTGLAIQ